MNGDGPGLLDVVVLRLRLLSGVPAQARVAGHRSGREPVDRDVVGDHLALGWAGAEKGVERGYVVEGTAALRR